MKKVFFNLIFMFIAGFSLHAQNPLIVSDSIIWNDCDSAQVSFQNHTSYQGSPWYYQWNYQGVSYNQGVSQDSLLLYTEISQNGYDTIRLRAYSDSSYSNLLYVKVHTFSIDTCSSNTLTSNLIIYEDNPLNCNTSEFTLDAMPYGGTPPYSFFWTIYDNGNTYYYTVNPLDLALSNNAQINVNVFDANNQNASSFGIAQTSGINGININVSENIIQENCDSTTYQFVSNYNDPITLYQWNINGISFNSASPVVIFDNTTTEIAYSLSITDSTGCTGYYYDSLFMNNNSNFLGGSYTINNNHTSPCPVNNCDFEVVLSATNGVAPFSYSFDGSSYSFTDTYSNLCEGNYQASIQDANGCVASLNITIEDSNSISVLEEYSFPNCDSGSNNTNAFILAELSNGTTVWSDGYVGSYYPNPSPGTYNYIITTPIGCTASGTIVVPDNNCYTISGNVYADINSDCIYNGSDYPLSSTWVDLADANGNWLWIYDFTDANGNYSISVPAGTYYFDINGVNANNYTQACPASNYSISIGPNNPNAVVDFFLTPPAPVQDLSVSLYSITTFTPGFPYWAYANYCNDGTIPMSGSVVMTYDANLTYVAGSSPISIHDSINRTLTWNFSNLLPGNCAYLSPDFTTSTSAVLGSTMNNAIIVNPIPGDATPSNNTAYVIDTVVGSWDPNDKAVFPNGDISINDKDHNYSIRFQNEGTAPATLVVVRDDLDDNLDLQTLRNVSASHNFVLTIENTDELVFTFNNIYLPAKQDDEEASQGNIHFAISQKENLPIGTEINNTAAIYFDFNEAVITNTTENKIVEKTTEISNIDILNDQISVFPNPSKGLFYIKVKNALNINKLKVYDTQGSVVFESNEITTDEALLNLQNLNNGLYLVKITTDKGSIMKKIRINTK